MTSDVAKAREKLDGLSDIGEKRRETLILDHIDRYWKKMRAEDEEKHEVPTSKPPRDLGFRVKILTSVQHRDEERTISLRRQRSRPRSKGDAKGATPQGKDSQGPTARGGPPGGATNATVAGTG